MNALQRAISEAGSQRCFAKICGVSQASVSKWLNGITRIGEDKALLAEAALNGVVTCEELRPDVNWSVLRSKKAIKK